jgi:hypothetical protein
MLITDAVRALDRDLRDIFDQRLQSFVAYAEAAAAAGNPTPTLAVVDNLTADDLRRCANRAAAWHESGLATPLLLEAREFDRSLDAFPLEFGAILADHVVVSGANPFDGLRVELADLRRACEVQARSHLLHLREGYIETEDRGDAIADLIVRSAGPLAALIKSVGRLTASETAQSNGVLARVAQLTGGAALSVDEARRIFPTYLEAVERLTREIDQWSPR